MELLIQIFLIMAARQLASQRPLYLAKVVDLSFLLPNLGEKLQMAISATRRGVVRSTSCLFLGWGFRGWRIERRHFRLYPAAIL